MIFTGLNVAQGSPNAGVEHLLGVISPQYVQFDRFRLVFQQTRALSRPRQGSCLHCQQETG